MCKVTIIPAIKKENLAKTQEFAKLLGQKMTKYEKDGIGYACITRDGRIFGEKWLDPDDAFILHAQPPKPSPTPSELKFERVLLGVVDHDKAAPAKYEIKYDRFGKSRPDDATENIVSIIVHARSQTTGAKNIQNTHPFAIVNDEHISDIALIHNGTINNHEQLTKKMSTCDSEVILHEYIKYSMNYSPEAIEDIADTLTGQYVTAVLTSYLTEDNQVVPIIDIFRSGSKFLYVAWVKELETMVFCTTKVDLEDTAKELNMTLERISEFKEGSLLRLDAITGERLIDPIKFKTSSYNVSYVHPYGTANRSKFETLSEAKTAYETSNKAVFSDGYYQVGKLTDEDKATLRELEKSNTSKTSRRAMELLKKAVGVE